MQLVKEICLELDGIKAKFKIRSKEVFKFEKKYINNCLLRYFAVHLGSKINKKHMELTEKEKELIEQIRNYKRAKHNPSQNLRWYILELFYNLLDD